MRKGLILSLIVVVAFAICVLPGCKTPKSLGDLKNISGGKFADTINVDKDEIDKPIKTQWGKIDFSSKQVKKIKNLKAKAYATFEVKSDKGKTIQCAVTYLGNGKYQIAATSLAL